MPVLGVDDTDSRTDGMCTTYIGQCIVSEIEARGFDVTRTLLVRLNPAAKHKTRGNAAVSIHSSAPADQLLQIAKDTIEAYSVHESDDKTNPGVVVVETDTVPVEFGKFAERAMKELLSIGEARELHSHDSIRAYGYQNGRGLIGATAAVGAWTVMDDWTYELIQYREPQKWGSERHVDTQSLFEASDSWYPSAWDTVDREEGEPVAVPHTPCPILYGVRGDTEDAVRGLASEVEGEPVHTKQLFKTNQGTDLHLQERADIESLVENQSSRVTGVVSSTPETKTGGHVVFRLTDNTGAVDCIAFEPTKRFRKHVRRLQTGDRITVCGELSNETIKLEKFAVRELNTTETQVPVCGSCGNSMESAGADQGYRCRDCQEYAGGKEQIMIARELEDGWYEVPPCARRHIAKPLIRGTFDAQTHPEK